MPFTLTNIKADLEDIGSKFNGAPNLGESPRDDVDGRRDWWADS